MKQKKIFLSIIIIAVCIFLFVNKVNAESQDSINNIQINVELKEDGTANVTEIWNVNINNINELNRKHYTIGKYSFENLSVKNEQNEVYELIDNWNEIEDKSNKCAISINEDNGEVDFFWGVKPNGNHTYTINYQIKNFVEQNINYQSIHFKFLQSDMNIVPNKASVTISSYFDFTEENIEYDSIGFDGDIIVKDSKIIFDASNGFKKGNYIDISMEFENDSFAISKEDYSSDAYKNGGILEKTHTNIYIIVCVVILTLLLVVIIFKKFIIKKND